VNASHDIATIASLLADDSRARMLEVLLNGGSLTATELALHAGISPQTASAHLAKLTGASLLGCQTQGRCRYYRLAGPTVAEALEALTVLAPKASATAAGEPTLESLRIARTCYDHLAGRLGVLVTGTLVKRRFLLPRQRDFCLTASGEAFLKKLGVDVEQARRQRRAFARQCVDWTERAPHLAGALGAAVAARCFQLEWVARVPDHRHLALTPKGRAALARVFAVKPAALAAPR
jgi:DNA-binding transcriptional ArsR family regulator